MEENNLHTLTRGTRTPQGTESKSPHHKIPVRGHAFGKHHGKEQMVTRMYSSCALGIRYGQVCSQTGILPVYCGEDAVKAHETEPHITGFIPDGNWKKKCNYTLIKEQDVLHIYHQHLERCSIK